MQRYFAPVVSSKALLSEADRHHLLDVMRTPVGANIEIVDGGDIFSAKVVSKDPLEIAVGEKLSRESELPSSLLLAFALLKHGNDEWILEKGTELGVASFCPFISSRTIVRVDEQEDQDKKRERYLKIVKGAAEQSKRSLIPEVQPIRSFEELLKTPADVRLLAYENFSDEVETLPEALKGVKPHQTCLVLIGPEGGFSPAEAEEAKGKGFTFVSLGRRILRAETAAIYAASVFGYALEAERKA